MSGAPLAVAGAPPPSKLWLSLRGKATPLRLRRQLWAVWGLSALLFFVGEGALDGARIAMKTVGKDTAPSILAAQEIASSLADLDANAGNYLLGHEKRHQAAAMETFEKQRKEVTVHLVDAARNITYGDAEKVPITQMLEGLGRYLEWIGESRYRKDTGDDAGAVRAYAAASDMMHQQMLEAAGKLDQANRAHLDHEYKEHQGIAGIAAVGAAAVGGLLAVALLAAQAFLAKRTRRRLNASLLGATLVAVVYTVYLVTRIAAAREDLKVATEDAFESIHLLWQARSIAYDANGDETRFLLGDRAAAYERDYREKIARLTTMPHVDAAALGQRGLPAGFSGLFAKELGNITFKGEREAAVAMVVAFGKYETIDEQIRSLERAGKHDKAVDLCIGIGSDQSNATFERFDHALHAVVDVNRKEFDATIERGTAELTVATVLGPLASLAIALLALLGFRPRLREYAA